MKARAALGPAVAEISILVDVRLIHIGQEMSIALGTVQDALELLDERLPSLRVSPAQQLLGFLPRQREAVQDRADRLAAAHQPEALAHPADQALEGPARRGVGPF